VPDPRPPQVIHTPPGGRRTIRACRFSTCPPLKDSSPRFQRRTCGCRSLQRTSGSHRLRPRSETTGGSPDDTAELAARLGTSTRALRTAQGMLKRHLSRAGQGQAGSITVRLDGIRSGSWAGAGLMVAAQEEVLVVGMARIADPLVLLAVGGPSPAMHWTLLPGGPSVTSRADGLKLIRGLAAGGDLTLRDG
jgi:hypothetical protein